jgi:hypothetical protein
MAAASRGYCGRARGQCRDRRYFITYISRVWACTCRGKDWLDTFPLEMLAFPHGRHGLLSLVFEVLGYDLLRVRGREVTPQCQRATKGRRRSAAGRDEQRASVQMWHYPWQPPRSSYNAHDSRPVFIICGLSVVSAAPFAVLRVERDVLGGCHVPASIGHPKDCGHEVGSLAFIEVI